MDIVCNIPYSFGPHGVVSLVSMHTSRVPISFMENFWISLSAYRALFIFFFFFFWCAGWYAGSYFPNRDRTHAPCSRSGVLTTPGNSQSTLFEAHSTDALVNGDDIFILWTPPRWWQNGPSSCHPSLQEPFCQVQVRKEERKVLLHLLFK